jgi:hypothetical protein
MQSKVPLFKQIRFNPEALAYIFSKTLVLWILETVIIKGYFHFLGIVSEENNSPPFFELLSYTGYKFVCLCLVVVAQLFGGNLISYLVLFITGGLFAFFFFQTVSKHFHHMGKNTL